MKIVVAPDSFKGSIESKEAAHIISRAIQDFDASIEVVEIPMADGGEGTVQAMLHILGGVEIICEVEDPLGRKINAGYGWLPIEKTAIIETASASGLPLLTKEELDPEMASTFGTGQLVKDALDRGAEKIIIGLGGSATVDGGVGLFQALGLRAMDVEGKTIERVRGKLNLIKGIDISNLDARLQQVKIIVASDVTSPLLGPDGAVYVFGPQKGIRASKLEAFEAGMASFAEVMKKATNKDCTLMPGSGAAGGIGFILQSLVDVEFKSGLDLVVEMSDFRNHLTDTDLVITGEGKIDGQSILGKVPVGLSRIAKEKGIPVVAIAGGIGEDTDMLKQEGIEAVLSIVDGPMTIEGAMLSGKSLLYEATKRMLHLIDIGTKLKGVRGE
ncbi:glycerate kinase [Sutcliffiella horikoshii]|uniref:glycerate kinase n=1 Tax=Sutcliffiella horikoshii TaxID=79883 RepID=UPI001F1FA3A8